MSGPKCSSYILTERQRRLILEQQEIELERQTIELQRQKDVESVRNNISELIKIVDELDEQLKLAHELYSRTGDAQAFINRSNELANNIHSIVESYNSNSNDAEISSIAKKETDACVKYAKNERITLRSELIAIKEKLDNTIATDIDKGFQYSHSVNTKPHHTNIDITEYTNEVISRLIQLASQNLPGGLNKEIDSAINKMSGIDNMDFLRNFNALTISPLEKKCRTYLSDYEQYSEVYYSLLARNQALSELLNVASMSVCFSKDTIRELDEANRVLEKKLAAVAEESYIAAAIDEVMSEMGYTVLGSKLVQKVGGRRFRSELYSFEDGTAVNVTYSTDGKITMELGGLSDSDRPPTSKESTDLCRDMERFCVDYDEIESRLARKGVVLNEAIYRMPPEEQFAQMINVNDYTLKQKAIYMTSKRDRLQGVKKRRECNI